MVTRDIITLPSHNIIPGIQCGRENLKKIILTAVFPFSLFVFVVSISLYKCLDLHDKKVTGKI